MGGAAAAVNPLTLVLEADRGFLEGDPVKVLPRSPSPRCS